jgi:hypothetical protein
VTNVGHITPSFITAAADVAGTDFTVFGMAGLTARLKKMQNQAPTALDRALYAEGLGIFRQSQKIVPVGPIGDPTYKGAPGTLRASGVVEGPTNGEVLIGYGGPAAPYAIYVHEDPKARHKPGKSYKFLEIPFNEAVPKMEQNLARAIETELEGNETPAPDTSGGQS